ncbi:MAG: class I SAM-dependent methyltransferase [Gammaproteobacteria bacterium]|nr:class I SAM-dependent methyltransferase [Gammaproteobacteria bacterium]
MTEAAENKIPYQSDYWNEAGGQRWLRNLERVEVMLAPIGDAMLARAAAKSGESVLDVGCGGGKLAARVAASVAPRGSVLGVDVSVMLIERAQRDYGATPCLTFRLADAGKDNLGSGAFDLVCSRFGIMFFADPPAAFANIARALNPAGRIVFVCWQDKERNPWMYGPAGAAFEHIPAPPPPGPEDPGPFCFADPERVRRILGGAGLRHIAFEPITGLMQMGAVDDALDFVSTMGPTAQPLADAEPGPRANALAAMRKVLVAHDTATGVQMHYATWLVSAARQ